MGTMGGDTSFARLRRRRRDAARDDRPLPTGMPGTQPNLSKDDKTLVFVVPGGRGDDVAPIDEAGDHHFMGGSLWTASVRRDHQRARHAAPRSSTATGAQNFYYPTVPPDRSFVVFNEHDDTSTANNNGDAFYNRKARVKLLHFPPQAGATPLDLPGAQRRRRPHATRGRAGARSSRVPRAQPILWVTFSSNRDYGLHLVEHGLRQLLPARGADVRPAAAAQQAERHLRELRRSRRSGWRPSSSIPIAALDATDRSYPAFWLPFQDVTSHNHSAQWVEKVQNPDNPDAGACLPVGSACGGGDGGAGVCCQVCCGATCQGSCVN